MGTTGSRDLLLTATGRIHLCGGQSSSRSKGTKVWENVLFQFWCWFRSSLVWICGSEAADVEQETQLQKARDLYATAKWNQVPIMHYFSWMVMLIFQLNEGGGAYNSIIGLHQVRRVKSNLGVVPFSRLSTGTVQLIHSGQRCLSFHLRVKTFVVPDQPITEQKPKKIHLNTFPEEYCDFCRLCKKCPEFLTDRNCFPTVQISSEAEEASNFCFNIKSWTSERPFWTVSEGSQLSRWHFTHPGGFIRTQL